MESVSTNRIQIKATRSDEIKDLKLFQLQFFWGFFQSFKAFYGHFSLYNFIVYIIDNNYNWSGPWKWQTMNWIPILFSRKMKIETRSPSLVTKHIPINCNRVCSDLVITPWVENVLTIAVECKVKDKLLPPVQEKVTHSSGFWFWEWLLASIRFLASITTCTISTPVVPEVSVKINSSTFLIKKILFSL